MQALQRRSARQPIVGSRIVVSSSAASCRERRPRCSGMHCAVSQPPRPTSITMVHAWYSTRPTVTKMADDRAEQLTHDPDKAVQELDKRVRADLRKTGDFPRVHALPQSGQDVPDDLDARLAVLGVDHPIAKNRVTAPRQRRRRFATTGAMLRASLATRSWFLALDKVRLQDLDEAIRQYLAWK